jgi:hypothetical protein
MIERCGDRQHKFDGLKKWPFHLFIESLPVMLQVALLLLACGLCKNMASINTSVASVLISLTVLGVLFYLGVVIAGTSSYECPFQTPVSLALRSLWKKMGPHTSSLLLPIAAIGVFLYEGLLWALRLTKKIRPHITSVLLPMFTTVTLLRGRLQHSWDDTLFLCRIIHAVVLSSLIPHSHIPPLPVTHPTPQEPTSWLTTSHSLWESIKRRILLLELHLPQIQLPWTTPPPTIPTTYEWLTPTALDALQKTNTNDVLCVSWILWNITDPEALDAAIRLATTVQWFQDGLNTEPPYNLVIFALRGCFDSTGKIHPGSRDRAYSSAQAILWIHICAMCVSEEFALRFPLPTITCDWISIDTCLQWLLLVYNSQSDSSTLTKVFYASQLGLPMSQWASNAILYLSWAKRSMPSAFNEFHHTYGFHRRTMPMNIMLNNLLVLSIFLGQSIDGEVLKVQDKLYVISISHLPTHPHCYLLVFT